MGEAIQNKMGVKLMIKGNDIVWAIGEIMDNNEPCPQHIEKMIRYLEAERNMGNKHKKDKLDKVLRYNTTYVSVKELESRNDLEADEKWNTFIESFRKIENMKVEK